MRRLFVLVAAMVLVDTMFFAALVPLLPEYSADLGLSKAAAGILSASYAAGGVAGSLPGAWLASRAGVRPTVLTGLGLMGASVLIFAWADDILLLDAARFVQGIGGACMWIGGLAWLISAAPAERRGELIGAALAAAIFGFLLGPVLGGAASVLGPEPIFSSVTVLALMLGILALRMDPPEATPFPGWAKLRRAASARAVVAGVWLVVLPSIFSGVIAVLGPLRLEELGASAIFIGAVFLVSALLEGAASPLFGRLSDRRGRLWPIRIGLLAAAVAAATLPLPQAILLFGGVVVLAELSLGLCWTPAMAMLSDAAERLGVGQWFAFTLVNLAWGGGQVIGSSGGGGLADVTSDAVPFLCAAGLLALTGAFLFVAGRSSPVAAGVPVQQ